MRLRDGVIMQEMDGQVVLVDAGDYSDRFNGLIKMNHTAAFVAELLVQGTSLEEITEKMTQKYDVTQERARQNAVRVVESFRSAGLLLEDEQS